MSPVHLAPGTVVDRRYRVEEQIGQGGMGTIYRCSHLQLPRAFALKVLRPELAADPDFVARFRREAVAASRVVHPNVVQVNDFGTLPDGRAYLAMEYLDGEDLDELLYQARTFTLERSLDILIQLADALGHCHSAGIVHRDLKTENVRLCRERGRDDVVKLVDFGIARLVGNDVTQWQITNDGAIFGTPEYIAPERALEHEIDGRSDIYAMGIIAYELVTGSCPFTGPFTTIIKAHLSTPPTPPSQVATQALPPAFDEIVLRCLQKKPKDRYPDCGALLGALVRLRGQLAGLPADASPADSFLGAVGGVGERLSTAGAWRSLTAGQNDAPAPSPASPPTAALPAASASDAEPSEAELNALAEAVMRATEAVTIRQAYRLGCKELAAIQADTLGADPAWGTLLGRILELEALSDQLGGQALAVGDQQAQLRREADASIDALQGLLLDLRAAPMSTSADADTRARLENELGRLAAERDRRGGLQAHERSSLQAQRYQTEIALADAYCELTTRCPALRRDAPDEELTRRLDRLDALAAQLAAVSS